MALGPFALLTYGPPTAFRPLAYGFSLGPFALLTYGPLASAKLCFRTVRFAHLWTVGFCEAFLLDCLLCSLLDMAFYIDSSTLAHMGLNFYEWRVGKDLQFCGDKTGKATRHNLDRGECGNSKKY